MSTYSSYDDGASTISSGVIAIIVVAVIILIIKVALICYCCSRISKRNAQRASQNQAVNYGQPMNNLNTAEQGGLGPADRYENGRPVWTNGGAAYRPEDVGKTSYGVTEPLPAYSPPAQQRQVQQGQGYTVSGYTTNY